MHQPQATRDDLSDFFDNAPVGLHFQTEDGRIRQSNHALAELLGSTREQLAGQSFTAFYADSVLAADHLERLRKGEDLNSAEVTLRSREGAERHVLVSASVLRNDGRFIHARVFTREIPALRRAIDALAQADARKAAILDASLDAIITMDAEGRLLDFNRAAESIFGYRRHEAIDRRLSELIIPPRLRAAHEAGLRRFLDSGIGPVIGRRIEVEAMRADGQEFPVELSIAVVHGAPPMFTATLRDVTERLRAERELQEALQALQQSESALRAADRRKDEFIATLAHELRNPLSPVRTAAEILARRGLRPEKIDLAVDVIRRQVSVMSRLLDDLLDVARVARGKVELRKELIAVGDVLRLAMQTAQSMLDAKSQRLELQSHVDLDLRLSADPVRLAQVLVNLLTNASKYSDPGQVITLRCCSTGESVLFEVEDRGIGFSSAEAERLFSLFTQLPGSAGRAQGGLGVGLALARSLMQLHGGTLQAHSRGPGQGATFRATLPLPADLH
ncbi:PAS domain S-box protein [Ramlibacter henchirensis]|uniref:histidine kinase n=1 Tax=Ramlibacter henchirensis TaxID=204072 RepID=A0A4Z0BQB8_9BURK|nr:PAS domain S-box protein [Ramlibacter henchirensis]TFZ00972.1 PAS domain S-box protein [Ramlibacter henchirensis]